MIRKVCLLVIVLSVLLLVVQISAFTFVNNASVPSDILTTIFYNKIKNSPDLINISILIQNSGRYNSEKCILGLKAILNQLPSLSVLPFLDSWGKFPAGILYGHLRDLGNFDQCIGTSVYLNKSLGTVNGQYCFADIPLFSQMTQSVSEIDQSPQMESQLLEGLAKIIIGICVPDTCHPEVLNTIFQSAADNIFNGSLSGITVSHCTTAVTPPFDSVTVLGIVIFSIVGVLMVLSTGYDVFTDYTKKPPSPVLLSFSAIANGRKLFAINTVRTANNIDCLNGIRVFSMAWVLMSHNYSVTPMLTLINLRDLVQWSKAASSMHILMATVSVDSFIFMGGLLVAWIGLRELDKTNGKLNVLLMYFHRYIRLTPPVAAVVLFYVSLYQYVGSGPHWDMFKRFNDMCQDKWWSTLLSVHNYVNPNTPCVAQSWYLAVDMQLYILSPLILIPLWKWGRKFAPVMILLSFLSIGCVISTYFTEGTDGVDQTRRTYQPTHTRYSVWLIGVGLGYFMYKNRRNPVHPSKLVQLIGWIVCLVSLIAILYGPYFTINSNRKTTILEAALFEALRRPAWGIALGWMVFACHFGFGGIVNTFLSHPFWQPLARLTYSLYLVHMCVQLVNFGSLRTDVYFSNYNEILLFWSTFGVATMAAIGWTLAFESPVLVLEKALLRGSAKKVIAPPLVEIDKQNLTESNQNSV